MNYQTGRLGVQITAKETKKKKHWTRKFGKRFEKTPNLTGTEAETAWLVNTDKAVGLFGEPQVPVKIMIDWAADWILRGGTSLGKPTHFETRNGAY